MGGYRRPRMSAGVYLSKEAAPYVAPWLLTLGAMPVAALIHFTVGSDGTWMIVLGVLFTLMTFGTWRTWKPRKQETRVTATVFTGSLLGWTGLAGASVPWQGDMLRAWVIGGFCLSAFWMVRHAGTVAGHDKDTSASGQDNWLGRTIAAFKDSKMSEDKVSRTDSELRVPVTLSAPVTAKDAQRSRDQIAAVAGVSADQVKVLKHPDHEGKATLVFNHKQDMSRPVKYLGPSAPGQSCAAAPLWLGRRTDGSDIEWWMPGSTDPAHPRNVAHSKTTGVTGSGKTETICTAVLDMRWRTDIVPVVGDPAKFQQSFGDIAECLGLIARTKDEVMQLFENLAGPVITYRSELLGSLTRQDGGTGYKQWEPECYALHGVPFLFVDIEEAADVIMDRPEEVYEAVRKLRSLGVKLNISMQTMPYDDIPRKVRGQFSESLAHGQNEYQDARYALSEDTLEAGADPTKWKNDAPGSLYAEVTGTEKAHWPVDGRAAYMTLAEKQMSMSGSRQHWAVIDPGTYERLAFGIDPAVTPQAEEDEEIMDPYAGIPGADTDEPLEPPRTGLDISFSDGPAQPVNMSTEEARRRLQSRLDVLEESNQLRVKFEDLADLPEEVGRSRGWVYDNLRLLCQAGRLKEFRPPEGGVVFEIVKRYPEAG